MVNQLAESDIFPFPAINDRPRDRAYRRDIDGLRAIAVGVVVAFHAGVPFFSGGFIGVDVFFVISGYLIGSLLYREISANKFSYFNFYARRARRILPVLFLVIITSCIVALLIMTPLELKKFSIDASSTTAAVSNIRFWHSINYFATSSDLNPLLMTWSLGVEEQFYAVFPLLMLAMIRISRRHVFSIVVVLCLISYAAAFGSTSRAPTAAFFLLPMRAWELGAGCLLAIAEVDGISYAKLGPRTVNALASIGLCLLLLSVVLINGATPFPGFVVLLPVAATSLLILTENSEINKRLLSNKAAVGIGLLSYSWYLWHWPFLAYARLCADGPIGLKLALVIVVCSLAMAWFSWRFVEQPFRQLRTGARSTVIAYGAASIALVCFCFALRLDQGWRSRFRPSVSNDEKSIIATRSDPCLAAYGEAKPQFGYGCAPTTPQSLSIALIGDSHAAALNDGIRRLAAANNAGFYELTKASCPALIGVTRLMPNHPRHDRECALFNQSVLQQIISDPKLRLVVVAGYWSAPFVDEASGSRFVQLDQAESRVVSPAESRQNLGRGLLALLQRLRSAGKNVVVVQDVPVFNFNPAQYFVGELIPVRARLSDFLLSDMQEGAKSAPKDRTDASRDPAAPVISATVAQVPGVWLVDPATTLCSTSHCIFADGSTLLYADEQHLTPAGADFVLSNLRLPSR